MDADVIVRSSVAIVLVSKECCPHMQVLISAHWGLLSAHKTANSPLPPMPAVVMLDTPSMAMASFVMVIFAYPSADNTD